MRCGLQWSPFIIRGEVVEPAVGLPDASTQEKPSRQSRNVARINSENRACDRLTRLHALCPGTRDRAVRLDFG